MIKRLFVILFLTSLMACVHREPPETVVGSAVQKRVGSAQDDALYQKRFAALRDRSSANGLAAYDPLKDIEGAQASSPLPRAKHNEAIDATAMAAARQYAEAMNSSAFLVWHDGLLVTEDYFGDTTQQTPLVSKSLAKPLSAIAVGRAINEGHIQSLDDKVVLYIKEWQDTPKETMTIRHLLGMRSGLLPQGRAESVDNVLNRAYLHPRHDEVIVNEYPLTHEPGTRYEYSNANGELIAVLIERATGVQYEDWVDAQVLKKIGAPGGQVWMNRPEGTAHSGCCWLLPAQSYLRMAMLLISDGVVGGQRILPAGFVADMKRTTRDNPHAGLGIYVAGHYVERRGPLHPSMEVGQTLHGEPYLADDLFLFDGNSNQVVYIVPSARLIIARLGGWPPRDPPWDNAVLPNTIIRGLASAQSVGLRAQPLHP